METHEQQQHGPATERHEVQITVNGQPVTVLGPRITGLAIKQAAIAQQVAIQLDFILSEELPNGKMKIIGDDDVVTVNKNSKFLAVAPDDNS